jgi:hypothetical protein
MCRSKPPSLNPAPFTAKEHVLATVKYFPSFRGMHRLIISLDYGSHIPYLRFFCNIYHSRPLSAPHRHTQQALSLSKASVMARFTTLVCFPDKLVPFRTVIFHTAHRPPNRRNCSSFPIWQVNLVNCAFFNTLHSQQYAGIGSHGGISQERFFLYAFMGSFCLV